MDNLPVPVEDVDYYIAEVELNFSDQPFDRSKWLQDKLRELDLDAKGVPLRAGDKDRPQTETTLERFI